MLKKIYYFYKSRGIGKTLNQIFKSISSRVGVKIIFEDRKIVKNLNISRKIFNNRKLINNISEGYWEISPMPSKVELSNYYSLNYWGSMQIKNYGINLRDLRHFEILNRVIPDFNKKKKKILNFGAGHGGMSIILRLLGHKVLNIEPSDFPNLFDSDWRVYKNLNDLGHEKFDLIYGSHSLEHVNNIDEINYKFKKLSNEETIFFFEVPNGNYSKCGTMENRIDIPHTYYFRLEYFKKKFKEIIISCIYDSKKSKNYYVNDFNLSFDKDGDCLIVVGKQIT